MKQLIEIEVDIPDGFRFKRWGKPVKGETSTDGDGVETYTWVSDSACNRIIIERDTPPVKYREPDSRDVGKPCEVRISEQGKWFDARSYVGRCNDGRFVVEEFSDQVSSWQQARIIDDTPQYRDATEADIGRKDVEFRDNDSMPWQLDGKLMSLYPNDQYNYEGKDYNWRFARVRIS